ncbi:MAG: hypothetical protein R3F37_18430 [Candidatus Competibacteraceae bacterium]
MVKVKVLRPPKPIMLGEKLLLKPGRFVVTVKLALAVPLFPKLEVKSPEKFMCVPAVLLVTSTVTVQVVPLPPTTPPVSVMIVPPSGAVRVPPRSPMQSEEAFAGLAIVTAAGRLSVNARPVAGTESLLVIVKVNVLTLPGPMVLGKRFTESWLGLSYGKSEQGQQGDETLPNPFAAAARPRGLTIN